MLENVFKIYTNERHPNLTLGDLRWLVNATIAGSWDDDTPLMISGYGNLAGDQESITVINRDES